ncbi:MAG: proton-translocating transhydrogenase family protein [Planctomycetota bacterium]
MSTAALLIVFAAATAVGYRLLGSVPSLLHTPLMSAMNAMSGVTVVAAVLAATRATDPAGRAAAAVAAGLGMVNVTAGFVVTHRMLRMFTADRREDAS